MENLYGALSPFLKSKDIFYDLKEKLIKTKSMYLTHCLVSHGLKGHRKTVLNLTFSFRGNAVSP